MNTEFVLWGTKNGVEDVIRINGKETQPVEKQAEKIKNFLEKRGDFEKIRIQKIDMVDINFSDEFTKITGKTFKCGKCNKHTLNLKKCDNCGVAFQ